MTHEKLQRLIRRYEEEKDRKVIYGEHCLYSHKTRQWKCRLGYAARDPRKFGPPAFKWLGKSQVELLRSLRELLKK